MCMKCTKSSKIFNSGLTKAMMIRKMKTLVNYGAGGLCETDVPRLHLQNLLRLVLLHLEKIPNL